MKKGFIAVSCFILILFFSFFLISCDDKKECDHDWQEESVIEEATCIQKGRIKFVCSRCKENKILETDMLSHSLSEDYKFDLEGHFRYCISCSIEMSKEEHHMEDILVEKEPTAYEAGIMKTKCNLCDYTSTREIEPSTHQTAEKYSFDKKSHWYSCIRHDDCSAIFQKELHDIVFKEIIRPATNEVDGLQKVNCSKCDYEDEIIIPAFNHKKGDKLYFDSHEHWYNCIEHKDCSMKFEQEEHTIETFFAQAPTCTTAGWEAYEACTRCDYSTKVEIPSIEHQYKLVHNDPAGHYEQCESCQAKTELIPHAYSWQVKKPATLYEAGLENSVCDCGYIGSETREIPAEANFKNDFSTENEAGSWKYGLVDYHWADETFDFAELTEKTEDGLGLKGAGVQVKAGWIEAGGILGIAYTVSKDISIKTNIHFVGGTSLTKLDLRVGIKNTEGILYQVPSFYGAQDNQLYAQICFDLKEGDTIYFIFSNAAGDTDGAYPNGEVSIQLQPATYQMGYFFDEDYHWQICDIHEHCNVKFNLEAHDWQISQIISSCTEENKIIYACSTCKMTKEETSAPIGHQFGDVYYCDDDAGHHQECMLCHFLTEVVEHTMVDNGVLIPPTAEEDGVMNTICSYCKFESTRIILAESHTSSGKYASDDTHHWHTCSAHFDCYAKLNYEPHNWVEIRNTANCIEAGVKTFECLICHKTKEEPVEAYHQLSDLIERKENTCIENGMEAHYVCLICELYFNEDKEEVAEESLIIMAAHLLVEIPSQEPTCTTVGWEAYEACTRCDYSTKVEIPSIEHQYKLVHNDPAGHYEQCESCQAKTELIPHAYSWQIKKPATLYEAGLENSVCDCGYIGSETREIPAEANFKNDFSTENEAGSWKYGLVDYHWADETFDFAELTEKTEDGLGLKGAGVQVKAGWIDSGGMLGIAYTVSKDISIKTNIHFVGGTDLTKLDLRIGIKDMNGNLYTAPRFVGDIKNFDIAYDLKEGDTIYFIFSNAAGDTDGAYPNGTLDIILSKCISFKNDFSTESGTSCWSYGAIDYHWADETFDFTELTEKTEDGLGLKGTSVQVKAGWIDSGGMLGIAYTAIEAMSIESVIHFIGETDLTKLDLRIGIKDINGNLYHNPTFIGNIKKYELTADLKEGDTIYFIFSNAAGDTDGAYPNGSLDIMIY